MSYQGGLDPYERRRDADARLPDPRMIPRPANTGSGPPDQPPAAAAEEGADAFVRPFLLTGGRTQPVHDGLQLHTLITSPPSARHAPLRFELRRIVEMCQLPHSVAEVAAGLGVPVGVARVLIADLIASGYAHSHHQDEEALSVHIIERIAQRVRAL